MSGAGGGKPGDGGWFDPLPRGRHRRFTASAGGQDDWSEIVFLLLFLLACACAWEIWS